jgi:hypothetical protein
MSAEKRYDVEWDDVGIHKQKTNLSIEAAESLKHGLITNKYGKNVVIIER